jgi:hypothetical protein
MPGRGLDVIPLRIPAKWDASWFESFVRDVLSLADVRNAETGAGIDISGTSDIPATISATADVEAISDAAFILADQADPALLNSRGLEVENGVLGIETSAGVLRIVLLDGGVFGNKIRPSVALSVLGNPSNTTPTAGVSDIVAGANGHVLQRVADTLAFGALSPGLIPMAGSGRLLGRFTTGAGGAEEITIGSGLLLTGSTLSAPGSTPAASAISYSPTAPLTATNVQAALDEVAALLALGGGVVLGMIVRLMEVNPVWEAVLTYAGNPNDGLRNFVEIIFV